MLTKTRDPQLITIGSGGVHPVVGWQWRDCPLRRPELERVLAPPDTPWAPPLTLEAYRRLPLIEWAELLGPVARYLTDYLREADEGPRSWQVNVERQHDQIDVPMYHVTSWYDIFLQGGIANFCGLRKRAMTERARAAQRLLIGPWAHLSHTRAPRRRAPATRTSARQH
jgi:hypothetical protein